MNFVIEIFQKGLGQLNPDQKVFLAAVLLICAALLGYSVRRLLHYSRRLQSIDSQLLKLRGGSGAA